MAALVRAATPAIAIATVAAAIVALALIGGGVALVWLHQTGALTEITLFGNGFRSGDVGAVGIFCGAVLGVIVIRRAIIAIERMGLS